MFLLSEKTRNTKIVKNKFGGKLNNARESYLQVEKLVLEFVQEYMPKILDVALDCSKNVDGDNLYFVTWNEKITDVGIVEFRSQPILNFDVAMKLYTKKLTIMEM